MLKTRLLKYFNHMSLSFTSELDKSEGTRQESTLSENNFSARHIKLTILSGYDHFVAVYHLQVGR